jgi:hypothetical protein
MFEPVRRGAEACSSQGEHSASQGICRNPGKSLLLLVLTTEIVQHFVYSVGKPRWIVTTNNIIGMVQQCFSPIGRGGGGGGRSFRQPLLTQPAAVPGKIAGGIIYILFTKFWMVKCRAISSRA